MSPERVREDEVERRTEVAAPQPAAPDPRAAALLGLQRSAGNAAVGRLLQRDPTATAQKTPQQECEDAIKADDWEKVAKLLNDNQPGSSWFGSMMSMLWTPWVTTKLASLSPDQMRYLDDAARRSKVAGTWLRTAIEAQQKAKGATGNQAKPGMGYGTVTGTEVWAKDGDPNATPKQRFSYRFEVSFAPDATLVDADEIAFIQTARIVKTGSGDNASPYGHKRTTKDHTKVDRLTGKEQGWYGMKDDETGGATLKPWVKGGTDPAWMRDTPASASGDRDYTFETSVVCRKGTDAGKVYAVVIWGFTVDAELKITPKAHQVFNKPTTGFNEAIDAWNAQAAMPEADRNAPGQKTLPNVE